MCLFGTKQALFLVFSAEVVILPVGDGSRKTGPFLRRPKSPFLWCFLFARSLLGRSSLGVRQVAGFVVFFVVFSLIFSATPPLIAAAGGCPGILFLYCFWFALRLLGGCSLGFLTASAEVGPDLVAVLNPR